MSVGSCRNCGVELPSATAPRYRRKWCSSRCRGVYRYAHDQRTSAWREVTRRAKYRKAHPVHWWRWCSLCGGFYSPRGVRDICPNVECFTRRRRNEAIFQNGRVRATRHGGSVERFDVAQVFTRDRFICHLCGGDVSYGLEPLRSSESATIDHLVPLEHGGDHTAANVATAHFRCNASRGLEDVTEARERLRAERIGAEPLEATTLDLYAAIRTVAEALSAVPTEFPGGPPLIRHIVV